MKRISVFLTVIVLCTSFFACTPKTTVTLDITDATIEVGKSVALNATSSAEIRWETSDSSVAIVHDGVVTGISTGTAEITAIQGKSRAVCKLQVEQNKLGTTHIRVANPTAHALISSGETNYKIVYPASVNDELISSVAPSELQYFFRQATGIDIEIVSDRNLSFNTNDEYLSVGETTLFQEAGLTIDKSKLGQNGYNVFTKGNSVFMIGGGRFGTLYAVYEFLAHTFGYEQYAVDEFKIERNVKDKALLDFKITDIPDFEWRLGNYGEYWYGIEFPRRMRMHRTDDIWITLGGELWHNFMETVPRAEHQAMHPEWYSPDGVQLCLSRDVEGLSNEVVRQMQIYIEANPNLSNLTFTQEDVNVWCDCSSCAALKNKYGVNSASNIKFINVVAEKIQKWLDAEHPDREIMIVIFAYHQVEDAPATYNIITGEYEPFDETVILADNVAVMYAPIFAGHYYDFDVSQNQRAKDTMKKWRALTDKIYLWSYSTYFVNYLMPYDSFNSLQKKYEFAYENGVTYLFDQGQYNQNTGTDWYRLKEYLSAKMSWDISRDMNALIDDFFVNYFKEGSVKMKEYFDSYRSYYAYLADEYGITGNIGDNLLNRRYWPESLLNKWLENINDAYAAIEPIASEDSALHKLLADRICLESISIRHLVLMLYQGSYTVNDYEQMRQTFISDCARLGVNNFTEWTSLEQMFNIKI